MLAGLDGSPAYVIETNLVGTVRCLDAARRHQAGVIFLSTSRVYPIDALSALPRREAEKRFELETATSPIPGYSPEGVSEDFPLAGARSIYGATKLCSELLITEYVSAYRLPARHVIHTVGPVWHGGDKDEARLLASCYRRSLEIADAERLATIAFPSISTGVYAYPVKPAARIAVATCREFVEDLTGHSTRKSTPTQKSA